MGVVIDSAGLLEVGAASAVGAHVEVRPISTQYPGNHYRASGRFQMVALQAVDSKLWEFRNGQTQNVSVSGGIMVIPTRFRIQWLQNGAANSSQTQEIRLYKVFFLSFDSVNTITPVETPKRTIPDNADTFQPVGSIRQVTAAGLASGMTGANQQYDPEPFCITQLVLDTTLSTGAPNIVTTEMLDDVNGTHPYVLSPGEGLAIRNGDVQHVSPSNSTVTWDFSWVETFAY